ncbi:MAG: hypothetical protein CMO01_08080 [Thalassobius sp.]|nr:hypothetical protein [Thalassovita sp.]
MKHYLLIEDDDIDVMITERMVKTIDPILMAIIAKDGGQAMAFLEKCMEESNIPRPEFIILDLMMPIMDGFEFLEIYEKKFYPNFKKLPIIVASSSTHGEDRKKVEHYPFVKKFVSKPLQKEDVIELI